MATEVLVNAVFKSFEDAIRVGEEGLLKIKDRHSVELTKRTLARAKELMTDRNIRKFYLDGSDDRALQTIYLNNAFVRNVEFFTKFQS